MEPKRGYFWTTEVSMRDGLQTQNINGHQRVGLYTCKPQIYPDENMFIELDERIWLHFFHNQQSSKTLSMIVNRSPKSGMGKKSHYWFI